MDDLKIVYSNERGTYNLFRNGEWYAEGDHDYIESCYQNCLTADNEEGGECYE